LKKPCKIIHSEYFGVDNLNDKNLANKPNLPGRLLETIDPDTKLLDKIIYLQLGKGAIHPIDKADRQVDNLSMDFEKWLNDDIHELLSCWNRLKSHDDDPKSFSSFNKSVHIIKGNAGILNNDEAGHFAATLSRLIERTCYLKEHLEAIELLVQAIGLCAKNKHKSVKNIEEIKQGFEVIINKKIAQI